MHLLSKDTHTNTHTHTPTRVYYCQASSFLFGVNLSWHEIIYMVHSTCFLPGTSYLFMFLWLTFGMNLQIGAIYLWSYVYNIVRISSRSTKDSRGNDFSISKSSRESSTSDLGSCTEPLISSKEFGLAGDDTNHYALPRTLSEGKAEVFTALS